jgi:hypothetical protein
MTPAFLAGQDGIPPAVAEVRPGAFVRARLGEDRTLSGRFVAVGDGRIGIRSDAGATDTLRLRDVGELAVRARHTKTGAIIGAVAGAAFGAFVGYMAYALCEVDSCRDGSTFLIAIPAFGAGGALVGAAVGSAFPSWKKVYP